MPTPLTDDEIEVLDAYLAMCTPPVTLDRGVLERLMVAAHLVIKLDRHLLDSERYLYLREQINTLADESAKIALHRIINALLKPGEKITWDQATFAGEGNPTMAFTGTAQGPVVARREPDGAYVVGPPPDGRSVDEHLAELEKSKTWTRNEATEAALAAARAAIPRSPAPLNPFSAPLGVTVEPDHYPENGTNPNGSPCVCGKPWPHDL